MGAHAPGPEDAQEQENGADGLANLTHSPQAIPAADARHECGVHAVRCHGGPDSDLRPGPVHPGPGVLLAGLAASAERQGITPAGAQVYGFTAAPILGGELSVSNIQVVDFVVSVNILGQLHRQVRDLPPGTRISEFRFES